MTRVRRLPLIEEQGLRTRAELGSALGALEPLDEAARGRFAHGKRVSAWLDEAAARASTAAYGTGHVTFEVDPRKTLAAPASLRAEADDLGAYWDAARPLAEWDDVPDDLEVHVNRGVRAKHLAIRAPLVDAEDLGRFAPLVEEVADEDRLSAKALMHLLVIACGGDFSGEEFTAAAALAWRDEPDEEGLTRELLATDPDKVAAAAIAMYGAGSVEVTDELRAVLEETRAWADEHGAEHGQGLLARTASVLEQLSVEEPAV